MTAPLNTGANQGRVRIIAHENAMQKALTQMNIQLANVISDLSGVTGR